jgi:two-component system NtrC family sensor kinase
MGVLFGTYIYFTLQSQEEHMMTSLMINANRISDFIKGSTRYGMLLNRREDTHQIINRLGREPGIEVIRVFNKKGEIMFSNLEEEIGTGVDMTAEACYVCHAAEKPIESVPEKSRTRIVFRPDRHRSLGLINPIKNELDCSTAECHAHPTDITVLGVLDIKMSLDQIDQNIMEAKNQVISFSVLIMLLINFVAAIFIRQLVHKPIHGVIAGAKAISEGNLDYKISTSSHTEIGALANAFNGMTDKLKKAYDEIKDWSISLENKVEEKTDELKRAHAHLFQIEKMASLGQLSATVAHELNNPLEGIITLTKLQIKRLNKENLTKSDYENIMKDLGFVAEESLRCGDIVKNLLLFSRQQVEEFKEADVEPIIERSIMLLAHHMQIHNIQLVRDFKLNNQKIVCSAAQVQQALIALIINSIEAMPSSGTLTIKIFETDNTNISIQISDTGHGIPKAIQSKIFEPFFTTKEDGKGVGLGLSVVYGIVNAHNGKITVDSIVGQGTTFNIVLPRKNNKNKT